MPFDDLLTPVAVPEEQQHDAASCCGRQPVTEAQSVDAAADETAQPDVGEGWRWVQPGEVLCTGDEYCGSDVWTRSYQAPWRETYCYGMTVLPHDQAAYRRRVTPVVPEAPQSRPAETRATTRVAPAPELSAAAVSALCQRNERDALLKKIATLRSESDQQQEIILHAGLEVERLTAEVERLRLTDQEMKAVKYFANSNWTTYHPLATVLDSLLRRWGIVI